MSQRTMLMVAAGLTAFVLVVVGALVSGRLTPLPVTDQAAGVDPNARQLPPDRPAYQQQTPAQPQAPAQPVDSSYPVTAEQAVQAAQLLLPGAQLLAPPELVDTQGVTAYEVRLDQGELYVDATSGAVLNAPAIGEERQESERHGHGRHGRPGFEQSGDEEDKYDD